MRVIAIEEHFMAPDAVAVATRLGRDGGPITRCAAELADVADGRLADMDAAGIDMQVLSTPAVGVEEVDPDEALAVTRSINDELGRAIAANPDRFGGFAVLPMLDPVGAATELRRTVTELGFKGALVNGHTRGRFLDDSYFWPIFEAAEALEVPIYLHPTPPPPAVREAYYSGLPGTVGSSLAMAGYGWHAETGLHALRLVVAGVFDRFPGLQVILGHMGEHIPFNLARADEFLSRSAQHLQRRVASYFHDNFWITTSGYFTVPPLICAIAVMGADRIIFSVDYPFNSLADGREFLDTAPISPADRRKIAHGNAERLLRIPATGSG